MATTTKITPTSTKHGYVDKAAYSYEGNIYIGKRDDGDVSRTRITLPSLRSNAAIGDNNIAITKLILRMYRSNGGPVNVTAKVSSSSAWNAAADGTGAVTISAKNGWYDLDLTSCAEAILGYTGNWYIHLSGTGSRVMCNGISASSNTPYMNVVWEYSANTLTTDVESVELGNEVHLNIAPQADDASYALTYEFGDEAGTIAETSAASITWTPAVAFASEIPNSESGEVKITMRVYDAEGNQKRTEILYLTVTVPESVVPTIADVGITLVNALGGYALTGKTHAVIAPVVDITAAYGATVKSVKAEIKDGGIVQTITWDALNETDAGVFSAAAQASNILLNAGEAVITLTVTDSRDREVVQTHNINVQAYENPQITAFSVERYEPVYNADEQITGYAPSDTGENVWITLRASCSAIVGLNSIAWKITAKTASSEAAFNGIGAGTLIDITNDRDIITAVVSAAATVEYTVEVTDTAGYNAFQYDNVTPGRANFALAGSKYGASFGCLPKGTEENPMLESAYPIYAYGGIDGVTKAKRTVLWTNPNPTAAIPDSGLQMNLASDDYDELMMFYKPGTTSTYMLAQSTLKGYGFHLVNMVYPSEGPTVVYRTAPRTSDTLYTVSGSASGFCNSKNLFNAGWAIPYQIIGIKYSD